MPIGVGISNHAVTRYLERVGCIEKKHVRTQMIPNEIRKLIIAFGNGKYPVYRIDKSGRELRYKLIVKNKTVLTVITSGTA